jgi:hypothetical protein
LSLSLVQQGFFTQEDARARFLYKINNMLPTRVVGMPHEDLEPAIGDDDALTLGIVVDHLEALL